MVRNDVSFLNAKEQKEIIALEKELIVSKHEMRMKEFEYLRSTEKLKHEWELERNRIKSAEIRKTQMRKEYGSYVK